MAVTVTIPQDTALLSPYTATETGAANTQLVSVVSFARNFKLVFVVVDYSGAPGAGSVLLKYRHGGTDYTFASKTAADPLLFGPGDGVTGMLFGESNSLVVDVPAAGAGVTASVLVVGDPNYT